MTTAATQMVVLLGHPVSHSRSPHIHTAAFAAAGIDAVYVTADVEPTALHEAVAGIRSLKFLGANITIPHKQAVAAVVDIATPTAALAGAVNTLYWQDDALAGDNTDISGLMRVLRDEVGVKAGAHVEIFGAGGVARAAAVACGMLELRVSIAARREEAADSVRALAERAGAHAQASPKPDSDTSTADVVINATPLGMHGEPLPSAYMHLNADQVALDLVYGDDETPFVRAARERGAGAFDGLGLLVAQAADSFEHWTGVGAPVAVMRAAVR